MSPQSPIDIKIVRAEEVIPTARRISTIPKIPSKYAEPLERDFIPADECCKKICYFLNSEIKNTTRTIRGCEAITAISTKTVCNRAKSDIEALIRFRHKLNDQNICKCYEPTIEIKK